MGRGKRCAWWRRKRGSKMARAFEAEEEEDRLRERLALEEGSSLPWQWTMKMVK